MEYPNTTWQEKQTTAFLFTGFPKNYVKLKLHDLYYRKQSHRAYAWFHSQQMERKLLVIISQVPGKDPLCPFYSQAQAEKMHNSKSKGKQKSSGTHLL